MNRSRHLPCHKAGVAQTLNATVVSRKRTMNISNITKLPTEVASASIRIQDSNLVFHKTVPGDVLHRSLSSLGSDIVSCFERFMKEHASRRVASISGEKIVQSTSRCALSTSSRSPRRPLIDRSPRIEHSSDYVGISFEYDDYYRASLS